MENFMKFAAFFVAIFLVVKAEPRYHRVEVNFGEDVAAFEDIMVDAEEQTAIVTVSKVTTNKVTPTINLYDFVTGYSVMKDVEHGTCYIERTRHTMSKILAAIEKSEKNDGNFEATDEFECTSKEFINRSDLYKYGDKISAFCAEYEAVFVEKTYTTRSKRALKVLTEDSAVCLICWGKSCRS